MTDEELEKLKAARPQIARVGLQFDYLKTEKKMTDFELIEASLDKLPTSGPITKQMDRVALQYIAILVDQIPGNTEGLANLVTRLKLARRRAGRV